ncbi:MAG: PQQ-binding-like beta-propeller repeat protein [Verrucomicrobia bacterium]|nr:PQQ-binding-like beta-propeller repeat protein [Verrucomicrobiota bacterium]
MKRLFLIVPSLVLSLWSAQAEVSGWLTWRGPQQTSVSLEKGLPTKLEANSALWTAPFPGQSTPVIADGKLYINGYVGDGPDLQEVVACFDADTGKELWRHAENDFLSDTIYLRYSTSSPTIDAETGNVYVQHTQGLLMAFTADGKLLWKHSMMEEFGRLTFPNSRTASPVVDGDLVITRGITSAWGAHGAAGDRFYAFDKKTGQLAWSSAPGDRPQDNTFSNPYLDYWNNQRVLYSAGGDSTILAINARTGQPIWRFSFAKAGAKGGINAALIRYQDSLVAVHESENLDSSEIGRMAAFRIPAPSEVKPTNSLSPAIFQAKELEVWRNNIGSLASSPVLVGDTIYEVTGTGDLAAVDARNGKVLWKKKLAIEQRQSTPFYADGYLYVAMYIASEGTDSVKQADLEAGGDGDLWVFKPGPDGAEVVSHTILKGRAYGSPIGYNGKMYLQTDKQLYAWGKAGNSPNLVKSTIQPFPKAGPAAQLQIIPYEVLLRPGQTQSFRIRSLDANGFTVSENIDPKSVHWEPYIPPTALVKATLKGSFNSEGQLVADQAAMGSGGQFKATLKSAEGKDLAGFIKGRVLPGLPLRQDFESFALTNKTTNTIEPETLFAYPPLPWNSARFRFEVRAKDLEGGTNQALMKTIENKLFQRGQIFFGFPDMSNYTIEADVLSEGNRRKMSEVGLINQRYAVILKGNSQEIEVNSNQERIKVAKPFKWSPNTWYRLKVRVDVADDGSGVVRGKAWKKGDPEPTEWTIEVPHRIAHKTGSPGLFGFAPQEQRVALDNITVLAN